MNVKQLASLEEYIKQVMPLDHPISAGNYDRMHEHGVYPDSSHVFSAYVELAERGDMEALKRALFYTWYRWAELAHLYGIGPYGLGENLVKRVLDIVNSLAESDGLDLELQYMLPFYFQVCPSYYKPFDGLDALTAASNVGRDDYQKLFKRFDYSNRGLMGDYWRGIGLAEANAKGTQR